MSTAASIEAAPSASRLEQLRQRQQTIAEQIGLREAKLAALPAEEHEARLAALGKVRAPTSWRGTPVGAAVVAQRELEEQLASLRKDAAAVAELVSEAEAEEREQRIVEVRAEAEVLRGLETEAWERLIERFREFEKTWREDVIPAARRVEALRNESHDLGIASDVQNVIRPFPLDFPSLFAKLVWVASKDEGDWLRHSAVADEEKRLGSMLPDLSRRALETVVLQDVEFYRGV